MNRGKSGLIIIGAKQYHLNYFSRFYDSQNLITLYTSSPAFAFIVSQFQYLLYVLYMQQRNASMYNIMTDKLSKSTQDEHKEIIVLAGKEVA